MKNSANSTPRNFPTQPLRDPIFSPKYSLSRQQIFDGVCGSLLGNSEFYTSNRAYHIKIIKGHELCSPFGAVLPRECFMHTINTWNVKAIFENRARLRRPSLHEWMDANYRGNENFFHKFMEIFYKRPVKGWLLEFDKIGRIYVLDRTILQPYHDARLAEIRDKYPTDNRVRTEPKPPRKPRAQPQND